MKLHPRRGVDDLLFGDSLINAAAHFGHADQKRSHRDERFRTTLYYRKKNLTLGFDADDRLVFIAALRGEDRVELWSEHPFEFVHTSADLQRWTAQLGVRTITHHDSFGARIELPDAAVTFCFSPEEPQTLEGVQLTSI